MGIPFTDQELKRAWRQLARSSQPGDTGTRDNTHRLLLLYAVECGLKVVWLKRKNKTLFDGQDISRHGHKLTGTLSELRAGSALELPDNVRLSDVKGMDGRTTYRNAGIETLHQVWRYGGQCLAPDDGTCEHQLERVLEWIKGEL